jgi:hypothetical protein
VLWLWAVVVVVAVVCQGIITTSRVTAEKKVPADFLQTSCGLPADFPDFTSFA